MTRACSEKRSTSVDFETADQSQLLSLLKGVRHTKHKMLPEGTLMHGKITKATHRHLPTRLGVGLCPWVWCVQRRAWPCAVGQCLTHRLRSPYKRHTRPISLVLSATTLATLCTRQCMLLYTTSTCVVHEQNVTKMLCFGCPSLGPTPVFTSVVLSESRRYTA